jgi:hypothetical protein
MTDNNEDSSRKHAVEVAEEGRPSRVRFEVVVPEADKGGTKANRVRRMLQDHPWRTLART